MRTSWPLGRHVAPFYSGIYILYGVANAISISINNDRNSMFSICGHTLQNFFDTNRQFGAPFFSLGSTARQQRIYASNDLYLVITCLSTDADRIVHDVDLPST